MTRYHLMHTLYLRMVHAAWRMYEDGREDDFARVTSAWWRWAERQQENMA